MGDIGAVYQSAFRSSQGDGVSHSAAAPPEQMSARMKLVHYSFATEDALVMSQCREAVRRTSDWANCDLIPYGARDEAWLDMWTGELTRADAVAVIDSQSYREKIENCKKKALKREA